MAYLKKSNPIISTQQTTMMRTPQNIFVSSFPFFKKSVVIYHPPVPRGMTIFVSLHIQAFLVCLDLTLIGQQQQVMQLCIAPGPRALTNQIYKRLKKPSNILDTKNPLLEIVVPFPIYVLHMYYCIQIKTTATQKSTQKSTLLCIYRHRFLDILYRCFVRYIICIYVVYVCTIFWASGFPTAKSPLAVTT